MNGQKKLVCVEAGLGITESQEFPVLGENGSMWEILLGGEYRKVNKRSGRVQGWRTGPRFSYVDKYGNWANQKLTQLPNR